MASYQFLLDILDKSESREEYRTDQDKRDGQFDALYFVMQELLRTLRDSEPTP
jgi:hypothetical protein